MLKKDSKYFTCYLFTCRGLLPPAYVVWREGNSFTLLVCSHQGGGYPYPIMLCNISQNAMGQTPGGYPARSSWGVPCPWGTLSPPGRVPPPPGQVTTRRAVCLLRSRRRTFLSANNFGHSAIDRAASLWFYNTSNHFFSVLTGQTCL